MRSQEELNELGPLLMGGRLDELRSRMLSLWPADSHPDQQDMEVLTYLLYAASQEYAMLAKPLYEPFAELLKRHIDEIEWLQSLLKRAVVVRAYEGEVATTEWLSKLASLITPPNNGIANLALADLFLDQGQVKEALKELRRALPLSISGFGWYRLEAIEGMIRAQLQLGNQQLAFEYSKTYTIEAYKMGLASAHDLVKACKGHAHWLGQIDYLIDLNGNVAKASRNQKDYSRAALAESEAALELARVGMSGQAAKGLRTAAEDAEQGTHPNDPAYADICRLLARLVDPEAVTKDELIEVLASYKSDGLDQIIAKISDCLVSDSAPDHELLLELRVECSKPGNNSAEAMRADKLNHIISLVGRYYEECESSESRSDESAIELYQITIDCVAGGSMVALLACQRLVELLLRKGMVEEAAAASNASRISTRDISDRFLLRQLYARSLIATDKRVAYQYTLEALSDWQRILEGLYVETHKVSWLRIGEECLRCAIQAISEPVDWMDQRTRQRELFRLMELSKARVISDMINRREYLPRPYQLSEASASRLFRYGEDEVDWNLPIQLQSVVYADSMLAQFHDYDGTTTRTDILDLEPLRIAIIRHLDPEARLLATAASLAFESSDVPAKRELYEDYLRMKRGDAS